MKYRLCVCLTERSFQNCVEYVSRSDADLIEHRLDYMNPIEGLREIYSAAEQPIIATCRPHSHGGLFHENELDRIQHLIDAIQQGASYVDIEVETEHHYVEKVFDVASKSECKIILSKHYTQSTPKYSTLVDLAERMNEKEPDILKIVVNPQTPEESRYILQLYGIESLTTPLIAFAMGEACKFTRVSALFMGAPFMYVSQDTGEPAAPGQISLSEMRTIVRYLS